jgi:hypothetical protein
MATRVRAGVGAEACVSAWIEIDRWHGWGDAG